MITIITKMNDFHSSLYLSTIKHRSIFIFHQLNDRSNSFIRVADENRQTKMKTGIDVRSLLHCKILRSLCIYIYMYEIIQSTYIYDIYNICIYLCVYIYIYYIKLDKHT